MNFHLFRQRRIAVTFAAMLVLAGCHKKVVPPPPTPPPPSVPAPTARVTADPAAVENGRSSTLTWTTTNAAQVTITGLGAVDASGSRSVAPGRSTDYTVTATGANGAAIQATARVTVTLPQPTASTAAAAPTVSEEELFARNVHDVYFDYDQYDLGASDESTAERDAAFLKSNTGIKVLIEGHCDDRGSEEYNLALGESRANTLRKTLTDDGVDASRIKIVSYGSEKPFCSEESDSCWKQNRRDHLILNH